MQVEKLPLIQTNSYESIIRDYIQHKNEVAEFVNVFPDLASFGRLIEERKYESTKRILLNEVLVEQYSATLIADSVQNNIDNILEGNTLTVTTGHQLCLYTGPLYFIYKIISTIRLSQRLKDAYPDKNFIPVYWMASEDHDFEEINHAFLFGNKIEWKTDQKGAVGIFSTDAAIAEMFEQTCMHFLNGAKYSDMIASAYSKSNLASAIRYLINELFGQYGLIIIDGADKKLKGSFKSTLRSEIFEHNGYRSVNKTIDFLRDNNYKIQVNPREINLFFLEKGSRERIEQIDINQWKVLGSDRVLSSAQMEELIENEPEKLSPNVIVRPLYQESILPNIAYVGGPGELAYWMQLKSFFDEELIQFPALVLRDSALLISQKGRQRMEKLGLTTKQLFQDKALVLKQTLQSEETSFDNDKLSLIEAFQPIIDKVSAVDITLASAARAELQKSLNSVDLLEKKMLRSLKLKEENKTSQIEKLWEEIYPYGLHQERHDNFFQFASVYEGDLIDDLMKHFDPLAAEMKVVYL